MVDIGWVPLLQVDTQVDHGHPEPRHNAGAPACVFKAGHEAEPAVPGPTSTATAKDG